MLERILIEQGIKRIELEEYLKKELERAGFTKSEIVKTPLVTRIVVNVTRPGLAIGKSGQNIKTITSEIEKRFKIDNPQLEIKEIEKPELDAQAMADRMKALIEKGFSWRSVAYRALRDIIGKGAQGAEIKLKGVLAGKGQRKRRQRIFQGYMKKVGNQTRLVDYAKADAYTKIGAIGIKVRIVRPETVFPDKVKLEDYFKKEEKSEEATEKEEKGTITEKKEEKIEEKEKKEEKIEEKETEKEKTPKKEKKEELKEVKEKIVKKEEKSKETAKKEVKVEKKTEEKKEIKHKKEAKEAIKEKPMEKTKKENIHKTEVKGKPASKNEVKGIKEVKKVVKDVKKNK